MSQLLKSWEWEYFLSNSESRNPVLVDIPGETGCKRYYFNMHRGVEYYCHYGEEEYSFIVSPSKSIEDCKRWSGFY